MTEQYRQISIDQYLRKIQPLEGVGPTVAKKLEVKRGAIDKVIGVVAQDFYLTPEEITGPSRRIDIVMARHVAAYLLFNSQLDMSYRVVALGLGRNDHTTTINAIRRVEEQMVIDQGLKDRIQVLLPSCASVNQ